MTDSGKHSALRQTDDGSFELVLDREGLQEVSEEEVSHAEVTAPEPSPAAPASSRVLIFTAAGIAALLVASLVGWFAVSPSDGANDPSDEVSGFKPYVGGGDSDDSAKQKAARRAQIAAIAEADEAEEVVEEEAVEEVVEEVAAEEAAQDEPGWELSEQAEDGVFVEVEGTDPSDELADVEVEEEEEEVQDVEPAAPSLMSQKRFDALRRGNLGRQIQPPRVPSLNGANPLSGNRRLPIRNIKPAATGEGDEEGVEDDGEEIVEDEEIVEEELQ